MRAIRLDRRLVGHRLHRVGIAGSTIYLQPTISNSVELWSLHTLFPNSWHQIFCLPVEEVFYTFPSCSYYHPNLFVLVVAIFKLIPNVHDEYFRRENNIQEYQFLRLAVESGAVFDEVPLENAILGCGTHNLHIYDRSMVMGSIPYWIITLGEGTFTLIRDDIIDETDEKCSRFPIAIDSGSRVFARLRDDNSLVVYNPSTKKWTPYYLAEASHLNLNSLNVRGLRETFGRAGHRMGAIESALTIHSDGSVIVAKIKDGLKHYFYRVTFDHERYEFYCERRGWARFSGGVDRMFYTIVGETSLIVIGIKAVAIAPLQPPTLVECALMALQDRYCKTDDTGARMGGLSPEDVRKMVGYRGSSLIPA
ncbi:hypothetical protein DICVIV_00758 [Dictyocaulus viviparus]|uniref:Uncharacterized protein n=1 Tax=Dictyocaulus viviparus TaxID=29172 RepID=A0A0D8Y889_DICVI|nr:hypothetical protein DICVIV_00758 [Dictyocaulus viviparus]